MISCWRLNPWLQNNDNNKGNGNDNNVSYSIAEMKCVMSNLSGEFFSRTMWRWSVYM